MPRYTLISNYLVHTASGQAGFIVRDSVSVRENSSIRQRFEQFLRGVVLFLMVSLAGVVLIGVIFRKAGTSLVWYDEVASILLAWLTFYGASLAALNRAHIGFPKLVEAVTSQKVRSGLLIVRTVIVGGFFIVVAWAGWRLLEVLEGTMLVSLPWVPATLTQSVIPVGALLFVVAEIISTTDLLRDLRSRRGGTAR